MYRSLRREKGPSFADARPEFASAVGTHSTGWGVSWADLDLDGDPDLVLANGSIPVTNLAKNAQHVQVIENVTKRGGVERFASVGQHVGLERIAPVNGRGLAVADYDNDGDPDVAINSIGGKLILLRNDCAEATLARGSTGHVRAGSSRDGDAQRWPEARPRAARRLELPLVRGPTSAFGLGNAKRVRELRVRFPDGREVVRTNVAADHVVGLG